MNTYTETKLFSITSNSATVKNNGTFLSDVMFEANNFIKNDPDLLNLDVALIHAEIPVSFYIINEYNNLFRFKLDTDPITTKTIPVGNYNATTLITALSTALNDSNFIITISKITGKLSMTHNKVFIIYNNFDFSIGKEIGFNDNTINNSVGVSNPFTLTPPNMLNLLGIKKINIVSNELMTINHSSEVGSLSLLTSLAVDQPSYGLIIYENKSGIKHNLKIKDINKLDILIIDENHDLINFNNIDWSMLFCFYLTRQNQTTINIQPEANIKEKPVKSEATVGQSPFQNKDLSQLEFLNT